MQMQPKKSEKKTWRTWSSTIAMGIIFFRADSQLRICIKFYFSRIPLKALKCLSAAGAHSMRGERRGQTGTEGRHVNKTFLGWPLMRQSLLQSWGKLFRHPILILFRQWIKGSVLSFLMPSSQSWSLLQSESGGALTPSNLDLSTE